MITTADALKVMTYVAACHHRTAPRIDDREVALSTASIWADLFNQYRLELPDLIDGVKRRGARFEVAPEPAEIIKFAREIRLERDQKTGPTPEYEALCESKGGFTPDELEANKERLRRMIGSVARSKGVAPLPQEAM